jgi:hypothetical protein
MKKLVITLGWLLAYLLTGAACTRRRQWANFGRLEAVGRTTTITQ